jgi:molybdate transport system ATP-binding protein
VGHHAKLIQTLGIAFPAISGRTHWRLDTQEPLKAAGYLANRPLRYALISAVEKSIDYPSGVSALTVRFKKKFTKGALIEAGLRIELDPPTVTVLFGPSGSGKTTILRAVAGLERSSDSVIRFAEETWLDDKNGIFIPPQRRRIGFLSQDYALFSQLTVTRNIRYGLRALPVQEQQLRISGLLERFKLQDLAGRFPDQLSGGQKQRVALARTLAPQPRLLLLDEPLSAIDGPTRETLRGELRSLLRSLNIPVLLVTHDRAEALALGDQIAVVDQGRIVQHASVEEVFCRPFTPAIARIVAVETVQRARVLQTDGELVTVTVGNARLIAAESDFPAGVTEAFVCIRAENVLLLKSAETVSSSARNRLPGIVKSLIREGPIWRIELDCGFTLTALLTRQACEELALKENDHVLALVKATNVHLIPR